MRKEQTCSNDMGAFESALSIWRVWRLMAGWAHWLSTVLAQDHFYSDFLSLLLTIQIHFESVMMIASAQHSLSVLTFVKLMIECVVHLLSRFVLLPLHLSISEALKRKHLSGPSPKREQSCTSRFCVTHASRSEASPIHKATGAISCPCVLWRLWERATSTTRLVLLAAPSRRRFPAHLTILLLSRPVRSCRHRCLGVKSAASVSH